MVCGIIHGTPIIFLKSCCGAAWLLWGWRLIGGWAGLISPLILLLTMRFITGPISERQSLKSKPDAYRQYQKTTSMMIPWFKSKQG